MTLVKFLLLSVGLSLLSQTAFAMTESYFICNSTGQPVPLDYKCDNYQDCSDGSDEAGCGSTGCSLSEFMCNDGNCIRGSLLCDGVYHCPDDSDEKDCPPRPCTSNEFRCASDGECIRMLYRCNGLNECDDGSDEMDNCTTSAPTGFPDHGCPSQSFRCADLSKCIPSLWRCDGFSDCQDDNSDERNCSNGVTCPVGQFPCSNEDKQCVFVDNVCDGHRDCTGSEAADEDEDQCFHQNCNSDYFACDDRCIRIHKKCNGVYDCIDNSDEFNCTATNCLANQHSCINGEQCVGRSDRCDGKVDCMDGSDEFLCPVTPKVVCEEGQFKCVDELGCLPKDSFCDGMEQCDDGSDEEMCNSSLVMNGCSISNGGCEGTCIDTDNGRFCLCPAGYHIGGADRTKCIDTDECAVPGTCSQLCTNTNSSYVCTCAAGYMIAPDGTCHASGPSPYLLVANYLDILRINLNGTSTTSVVSNLTAVAVDFHFARDMIFWIDIKKKAIMKSSMDGSQVTELINYGMRRPEGLAVDWINDKIYWTDTDQDTIEVAGISGSPRTVLISRTEHDDPTGIVVDPTSKMIFWIEHTRIMKASMDGNNVQILHDVNIYGPTGLTLHNPTSTLYWVDLRAQGIDSSHINGTQRRQIRATGVMRPISVSVFEDTLYWLEGQNPAVVTTNRQTGENTRKLPTAIYKPMDLVVVHPLRQPRSYTSPCAVKNGGCSYLCLLSSTSPLGFTCLCPFGTEHTNSTHCSQANKFLLFSRTENLHTIPLQQDPPTDLPDIVLPVSDIMSGGAVDWDSDTNTIFWADRARGTISSSHITGNDQKVIIDADIDDPVGIAVDWVSRNLYWADKALSRICVSSISGLHTTILLFEGFKDLNDIAVHPMTGEMFWVDNGDKKNLPIIEKANLDGTGRTEVYSIEKIPNTPRSVVTAISIDYSAGKLYWVDRGYQQLNSINLDGSDKQTVLDGKLFVSPTGLVAFNGIVFWADLDDKTVHWLNASNADENDKVIEDRKYLRRITLFHRERPKPASHPCWVNNGSCSQLCLSRSGAEGNLEATCACRIGYQLQEDNRTCQSTVNNRFVFATGSGLQWFSEDVDRKVVAEPPILPFSSNVISLDIDRENDTVYWIDTELNGIYRAPLKGGPRETIITKGLVRPVTVVVDWMGKNLYWADSGTGRIEVSRLNGDYRRVLVEGGMVNRVAAMIVDLKSHYMFWATSSPPRVYRAVMDGSRVETIVSQGLINPVSLSIHNPGFNGIIYIMDSGHQSIFSYSLDGRQLGIAVANAPSSTGLAYDNTYLYYVKRTAQENMLYRVGKSDGSEHFKLISGLGNVRDMKYIKARQWLNRGGLHYPSACLSDGPCSGLCLPNLDTAPDQYTCACSTGVVPDSNNACKKYPSLYIIFSTHSTIQRISLDLDNSPTTLLISNQQSINFVDYDLGSNTIVWTDNSTNAIMTSDLSGNDIRVLKKGMGRIGGIAVDWITGNVYYTEPDTNYIGVMHPAGFYLQLSFSLILNRPTSIAVDPRYGYMFWINGPRLARASMDGSYSTAIHYVGNAEHLTMDVKEKRLYWFKPDSGRVESVDYSGHSYSYISSSMESPSSLGFHDNFVFWVNSARKAITRARKSNGHNIFTVLDNQKDGGPRRIAVVSSKGRPGETDGDNKAGPCSYHNGGCSHFCLATSSSQRFCACPSINFVGVCSPIRGVPPPVPVPIVPTSSRSVTVNIQKSTQLHSSSSPIILSLTPTSTPFNVTLNQPISADNLSGGEISMLVIIVLLFIVVAVFVTFLLLFFTKRKSLPRYRVTVNPTSISAWNPTFRNRDSVSPTLSTLTRKNTISSPPLSPSREKSSGKPVLMSVKTKSVSPLEEVDTPSSEFEKPEVYKMTPQQCRKSMSTPPASPLPVATTVQVVVNPLAVHPAPPLPPKPDCPPKPSRPAAPKPVPQIQDRSTSRAVKFDLDPSLEPPPIPPRSNP